MDIINISSRSGKIKPSQLRAKGIIPGSIYGPSLKSTLIEMTNVELNKIMHQGGEVFSVKTNDISALVKFGEVQTHPFNQSYIHFSLIQLDEGIQNEMMIPVEFIGNAPGTKLGGILMTIRNEIKISGKPREIPEKLIIDISHLEIGHHLCVKDLALPANITAMEDADETIIICKAPNAQETVEVTEAKKAE